MEKDLSPLPSSYNLPVDLFLRDCEHLLEVTMEGGLQNFVAPDGFQVGEIDIYQRRRRQHNRQIQREHEPEPVVAAPELSLQVHANLPAIALLWIKAYASASHVCVKGR